jgi:hypothetical protein
MKDAKDEMRLSALAATSCEALPPLPSTDGESRLRPSSHEGCSTLLESRRDVLRIANVATKARDDDILPASPVLRPAAKPGLASGSVMKGTR